jgi:hypothetical protein
VDDDSYPETDSDQTGISGWFKLEFWNFYYNGIEFIMGIESAVRDERGRWALIDDGGPFDATRFEPIRVWKLARIPYRNIVDYDIDADEYYNCPHLYCRFADGGTPYEGFRYALQKKGEYPLPLDSELQFEIRRKGTRPPRTRRRPRGQQ